MKLKAYFFGLILTLIFVSAGCATKANGAKAEAPESPKTKAVSVTVASEDEKKEIKNDIEKFVNNINGIIKIASNAISNKNEAEKNKNFFLQNKKTTSAEAEQKIIDAQDKKIDAEYDEWTKYLTERFKKHYSSPEVLNRISNNEGLANLLKGHKLTNLKDYFIYVVIPVRQNSRVAEIDLVNNNKNKIKVFRDDDALLYYIVDDGSGWKIDIIDEIAAGHIDF